MPQYRFVLAALGAAVAMAAQGQQAKPENQIKYRKAAYSLMDYSYGVLDDMAKGKRPYSRDEAVRNAELLAQLARVPKGFFGEGTDKGETRAKPEIWANRGDFDAKMDKMVGEADKLARAARAGEAATLGGPLGDLGKACKACHDDYRIKRS